MPIDATGILPAGASGVAEGLGLRVAGAARWRLLSLLLGGGLQFGVSVGLARLLQPADFGLATLASIIVGLAALVLDLGLGLAVVQCRPLSDRHVRVSFTLAILAGGVLSLGVLLAAPLAATLLRANSLAAIMRLEAPLFLFAGIGVTARALLQRRLEFRRLFLVDLISFGFGYALTSFTMALLGFGVWSLVAGALVQSLLANTLVFGMTRHPIRPLLVRQEATQLLRFGTAGTLNGVVNHLAYHGDNLVVGRLLGASAVGLYARAFSLMMLPLAPAGNTLFSVLFPALSEVRNDRERFARTYLMAVAFLTIAIAPMMAAMVVVAPQVVQGLYGRTWLGAVRPLQVFCAVGLFRVIASPAGAVTHASGQVYAELRRQAAYALCVIIGALVGARWGITGVALGVSLAIVFKYVVMVDLSLHIAGASWHRFLSAQAPGVALAGFVGAVALVTRRTLEAREVGSLSIVVAVAAACACALPVGLHFLPAGLRPRALFERLTQLMAPLPVPLRYPLSWALRPRA